MNLAKLVLNQPTSIYTVFGNGFKIYALYQEASTLKELIGFIGIVQTQSSRQINKIFVNLSEHCKNRLSKQAQKTLNSLGFFTWINLQQKEDIISEINQCQSKLVSTIFYKELFGSIALILKQMNSQFKLSTELNENINIVENSKVTTDGIIVKLDDLEQNRINVSQTITKMTELPVEEVDSSKIKHLFFSLISLNTGETKVRRSINQVKTEVGKKMARLSDQNVVAFCDTCMNASQVASNILEYSMAGTVYSTALVVLKLFTTTLFAAMSVVKYKQSQLASQKIEELSEILRQLETFVNQLESVQETMRAAMALLNERRA